MGDSTGKKASGELLRTLEFARRKGGEWASAISDEEFFVCGEVLVLREGFTSPNDVLFLKTVSSSNSKSRHTSFKETVIPTPKPPHPPKPSQPHNHNHLHRPTPNLSPKILSLCNRSTLID